MPTLEAEVSAIVKENADLMEALVTGCKWGVRYKDYQGWDVLYYRHKMSAEHAMRMLICVEPPELFEL